MKKQKWLLIIVGILFVINILFFVLVRLVKVDKAVQNKLENYLSQKLNAEITIEEFSFNDKQINIYGLSIVDQNGNFEIQVPQIYLDYKISDLFFSGFTRTKSVEKMFVYQPQLKFHYQSTGSSAEKFTFPDLNDYFKELTIFQGNLDLELDDPGFYLKKKI
ncbi:MAG: hypothetical protein JW996_03225, partial [Candidatus Cloacimonetes bacterium]|nr:hypothetical protein [Candidatus Cloacimonadota bacterium]